MSAVQHAGDHPAAGQRAVPRHGKLGDDRTKRDVRRARCGASGPARQDRVMSLPAGQRRALNRIEKTLADDHPSLGPLFAIFTRLTGHEAMPVTENVTARLRWRWMRPAVRQ
jgi:hypothetical protein